MFLLFSSARVFYSFHVFDFGFGASKDQRLLDGEKHRESAREVVRKRKRERERDATCFRFRRDNEIT